MYYELRWFSDHPDYEHPYCFNLKTFYNEKQAIEAFNETKDITEKCTNDLKKLGGVWIELLNSKQVPVASMIQLVARDNQSTWLDEIKLWERGL